MATARESLVYGAERSAYSAELLVALMTTQCSAILAASISNLISSQRTGESEKMVLSKLRTALCGRRPPVGLHFAGLTHPSPIVTHFLANLGSDLREACSRLHPEPCRMPADQIRPARPRRPARPKRPVMISRLTQVASIPGVRGARRGLLPAGPPLEKRVSPVSAFPPGPSAPWPLELLACDRLPQLANL